MDAKSLETIRITAHDNIQRCRPTCPSSATCPYRHARKKKRNHEPCTRELLRYKWFVSEVTQGSEGAAPRYAFDLMQAAIDAALLDLLVGRCARRLAGYEAFVEEASKAIRPGPGAESLRPEVNLLMRLIRRKNKLIDKCRALRHDATDASPPEQLSLCEFMQGVMEVGKEDIYEAVRHEGVSPEQAASWSLPGDYPRNGKTDS